MACTTSVCQHKCQIKGRCSRKVRYLWQAKPCPALPESLVLLLYWVDVGTNMRQGGHHCPPASLNARFRQEWKLLGVGCPLKFASLPSKEESILMDAFKHPYAMRLT
eukprot:scaffold128476_cov20-Tisochrysis_lutea.AAC.1